MSSSSSSSMVLTTKDLEDGFAKQNTTIKTMLDDSIAAIRLEILNHLKVENQKLHKKIDTLEAKVIELEKKYGK